MPRTILDPDAIDTAPMTKLAVLSAAAHEAIAARDAIEDYCSPEWDAAHEEVLLACAYARAEQERLDLDSDIPLDTHDLIDVSDDLPLDLDDATDPDATAIWSFRPDPDEESCLYELDVADASVTARFAGQTRRSVARRRRLIRTTRQDIDGLRDAIAAGWDVGPELAHEERRLAALVATDRW